MGKIFLANLLKFIQNHTQKLENFLFDKDMIIQLVTCLVILYYYPWFFFIILDFFKENHKMIAIY